MSRMSRQKSCPSRSRADSLRSETVSTSTHDARAASARIAGEGYCDVPSMSRERSVTPYGEKSESWVTSHSSFCRESFCRETSAAVYPGADSLRQTLAMGAIRQPKPGIERESATARHVQQQEAAGDRNVLIKVDHVVVLLGARHRPIGMADDRGGERVERQQDRQRSCPDAENERRRHRQFDGDGDERSKLRSW